MNTYRPIKLLFPDVAGGGGAAVAATGAGGAPDFVGSLPEALRVPSIQKFKSAEDLAKSYISLETTLGQKRLPAPEANWDDNKWSEHYDAIGRPKTPADYKVPEFKFDPKIGEVKLDDAKLTKTREVLHQAGLTQRQVDKVLGHYLADVNATMLNEVNSREAATATATQTLKNEWGEKFEGNLNLAKATIRKYGGQEFMEYVEKGMGNNVPLIKMMAAMGQAMLEDVGRGGNGGDGLNVTDQAKAQTEIEALKRDKDFTTALNTRTHPGHKDALARWQRVFSIAFPGKQEN